MVQESEGSRQITFIVVWGTSEYSGGKKTLSSKELLQLGYLISQDYHSPTVGVRGGGLRTSRCPFYCTQAPVCM